MIKKAFDFSVKRSAKEAVKFYFVWLIISISFVLVALVPVAVIAGYIINPNATTFAEGYTDTYGFGQNITPIIMLLSSIAMSILTVVVFRKRTMQLRFSLIVVTFVLTFFTSFFGGLLIPAYLTTRGN